MSVLRRSVLLAAAASLLAGCDDEPAQRKAFIAFLQTRILDKPGIHVPRLDDATAKSFGPYAGQYAIITDFHAALNDRVSPRMDEALRHGMITSIADLQARRGDLETMRRSMADTAAALDAEYARANDRRTAAQQPADLRPVFDAAFERTVAAPYRVLKDALPAMDGGLAGLEDLLAFLDAHPKEIKADGPLLQVSNPALQRELQAKLDAVRAKGEATLNAGRRIQAMVSGS